MSVRTAGPRESTDGDEDDFVDECARPMCRREFRRAVTAGRPQEYCDEFCRRQAGKEIRRLKAKLARYEALAQQTRIDVAAHGRDSELGDIGSVTSVERRAAEDAVVKAEGVLDVVGDQDTPVLRHFKALFDAVAPVIREGRSRAQSA